MFKIKNPFKKRVVVPKEKGIGELAWESLNLENEKTEIGKVKVN